MDLLREAAARFGDAEALWTSRRSWSFRELDAAVDSRAARIDTSRHTYTVAADALTVIHLLAALRAGVAACPISPRWPHAQINARLADLPPEPPQGTIIFTSGSGGSPKAAVIGAECHRASATAVSQALELREGDSWLLCLPMDHVGGISIVFRCLLAGATIVIGRSRPTNQTFSRHAITHASLVPTQLSSLLAESATGPNSEMRAVLLGGAALPEALWQQARVAGWPVRASYGSTEMASTIAIADPDTRQRAQVLPHCELRIGVDGEIQLRGPSRFAGYARADGLQLPFDAEGWFGSRDRGHVDANGYLQVLGRLDHMFISGGENVHPEEIEAALLALPGVVRACVVPVDDAEFGQRPVAYVEPESADFAALEQSLPRFKIPIAFLPFPASTGLKPNRAELAIAARRKFPGPHSGS
ncbi:MAG: O-succinylbenzoic acid--CoA ligase [Rhodothermales bacterium]|jgi:O-succinylbenzoic acid--CoA ligase